MRVLAIETTCDETAAAVIESGPKILSDVVFSQVVEHAPYGGVVPEIASRSHVEQLTAVIEDALEKSGLQPNELDGIAVAHRPGLIGALMVGVTTAKAIAWAWDLPLIGVNHLEAHLESAALGGEDISPPYLGVVLSGGHTDMHKVDAEGKSRWLGGTRDDAVGEAFDKVAAVLGLGYPGGPIVEKTARSGDPKAVKLPRTLLDDDSLDFSFSGIKTAVLYKWRGANAVHPERAPGAPEPEDICASFQQAIIDVIAEKIRRACRQESLTTVLLGGGVTANGALRKGLKEQLGDDIQLRFPPPQFATDNAAMIGALALRRLARGEMDTLELVAEAQP
ncbi:MAG: tRNA (adenosine(37)-N6)-threonylcarbamoyltransferase complex transferase subunit TsaD [Planctomycetota bacterium]